MCYFLSIKLADTGFPSTLQSTHRSQKLEARIELEEQKSNHTSQLAVNNSNHVFLNVRVSRKF